MVLRSLACGFEINGNVCARVCVGAQGIEDSKRSRHYCVSGMLTVERALRRTGLGGRTTIVTASAAANLHDVGVD